MWKRAFATTALACLVVWGAACTMWKNPPKGWVGTTGGEQLERLLWEEVKAKNWKELEKHVASTFTAVTPSRQQSKAAFLEQLKQTELAEYSLGEFNVQLNGNEFVVSYVMTARGSRGGQPLPSGPWRMMSVWQQASKGWILIAHAETPASEM